MKRGTAMAVQIRSGTEADVDEFIRISHAIWRHSLAQVLGVDVDRWPMIAGNLHAQLIPVVRAMLVAIIASRVVGFSYRNCAMIEDLWIDPPFQREGIGPQLLSAAVEAIAADGYGTAMLECLETNVHARRFYEREGWRPVYRYSRASQLFRREIPRIRFEYDVWRLKQS